MQTNIAIQSNPPETAVTAALRQLAAYAGWCVTHTTDGGHAKTSLHYSGRAVDLADFSGATWDSAQLLEINQEILKLVPLPQISELIYSGPGGVCVKNGVILDGKNGRPKATNVYDTYTMSIHHNHNHFGVPANFKWTAPAPVVINTAPSIPAAATVKLSEASGVTFSQHMQTIPALDDQGRGWFDIAAPMARVFDLTSQGSSPPDDHGYWTPVVCTYQDRGGITRVTLKGDPHQATNVFWKTLES